MMDLVLQTNIFFYITSAAVIVVTVLVCIVLYYLAGILRDVRDVTSRIRQGTEKVSEDLESLRSEVRQGGAHLRAVAVYFARRAGFMPKHKAPRARSRSKNEEESV